MADAWTQLTDFLSNPGVTATISGLILLVVGYYLGKHSRREERKLVHSVELNNAILIPWSEAQIGHIDAWQGPEPTFWHPRLSLNPYNLQEQPAFRWAREHLQSAYPDAHRAWVSVNRMLEFEIPSVESLKAKVLGEFARGVEREFDDRIKAIDTKNEHKKDVYYADVILYIIVAELWAIFSGRRNPPRTIQLSIAPLGAGGAYVGSSIAHGGYEVARVSRYTDADEETWQKVFDSVVNTQDIRSSMEEVVAHDSNARLNLEIFTNAIREIVQKIANGVPIRGKCELESDL